MPHLTLYTLLIAGILAPCLAQTEIYRPYRNHGMWSADTLYLGVDFARDGNSPITIWLKDEEAGMIGELYYVEPNTGREVALFRNRDTRFTTRTLTDIAYVPTNGILTFMYRVRERGRFEGEMRDEVWAPKYSGRNRRGSRYFSPATSNDNANPNLRFGHRWSAAGRVDANVVEFGFEDDTSPTSDMDFDDIIFQVSGVRLVVWEKSARARQYWW